jgi:uncharacterized metal-binding protein YceD (DUF177 family)
MKPRKEEDIVIHEDRLISISELVEDQLMLALPMIARHDDGECPETDYEKERESLPEGKIERDAGNTYRPFFNLAKEIEKPNL